MSDRVFERANRRHGALVAGFAATAHWCPRGWTLPNPSHDEMVHQ